MDKETINKVKKNITETINEKDLDIDQVIVFGSRARQDYRESSDVDLLIVSEEFQDMPYNKRPKEFYLNWDYDKLPEPEFICLTPEEYKEKKQRQPHIVRTAVEEGIEI